MQIIQTLINHNDQPLALTIGNFDGVHIGHQKILQTLVEKAEEENLVPAAMTFAPHAKVFFGRADNFLINSDDEKATLIAEQGIKTLYQLAFTAAFSQLSPEQFLEALSQLRVKYLLVGDDFRFGYKGQGDFSLLQQFCADNSIGLSHTPTIAWQGTRVSSSRVREAIHDANFAEVNHLLGRSLVYQGTVIKGKQLGRTIDFPTANVALSKTRLLPNGVFAVNVQVEDDDATYQGMCNIGTKPTVDDSNTRLIETHIFDFSDDLYGKIISVNPVAKIRDEQKFDGVDALVKKLHRDKNSALELLDLS